MKTLFKFFVIILSLIGFTAIVSFVVTVVQKHKLEKAYECNCQDVKIGMHIQEAMEVMKRGLKIDYQGFDYVVKFNGNQPSDLYITYSTNGGSYWAEIYYDKNTGEVTKVQCPPKNCSN